MTELTVVSKTVTIPLLEYNNMVLELERFSGFAKKLMSESERLLNASIDCDADKVFAINFFDESNGVIESQAFKFFMDTLKYRALLDVITVKKERQKNVKTYLVKNKTTGLYKIGKTTQIEVQTRVSQFEGMSGGDNEIIGFTMCDIENQLHREFKLQRVKGEWFNLDSDDVKKITELFDEHKVD